MRGVTAIAILSLLIACGEDEQGASTGTTTQSASTGTTAPQVSAPRTSNTNAQAAGSDPWLAMAKAVSSVQSGALTEQMTSRLTDRKKARDVEETQIRRSLVSASGALAAGCGTEKGTRAFVELQTTESSSLEKDRAALVDLLTMAGAEGRKTIWEAGEVGSVILSSRQKVASELATSLPSKISEKDESDTEGRRVLVSLKFAIEAVDLDTQAALSSAKNDIEDMDPSSDDAINAIAATLQRVDEALLTAQKTKFERLKEVCELVDANTWLSLLESGAIGTYIGRVGGQGGIQSVGGRPMGGGQMGGGQMGGGQMGGGQMGGGQMGGGQMGGGQMGGGQMGGGQMGGGQSGGGQMGGNQNSQSSGQLR